MTPKQRTQFFIPCEERRVPACRRELVADVSVALAVHFEQDGWFELSTGKIVCPECGTAKAAFMRVRG